MVFMDLALFLIILSNFLLLSTGQTTHTVTVGQLGSFYDPPELLTGVNDTVTFVFAGPFHTVTQSTLDNPCVALAGGFNSGVVGRGTNNTNAPTPTWTIRITNNTEPIYYFCEISTPTSHCESGMVGVINPSDPEVYMQFQNAAKAVTGTPSPTPTLILTGIGAAASQGPITPSPTPSPSPSPSPSSNTPVPVHNSHLGTIIGAAVGGACGGILIVAALIWWLVHHKAQNVAESPASDDSHFFRYDPGPIRARRPSEAFVAAKAMENSVVTAFPLPNGSSSPESTTPLAPNRRASIPPVNVVPPGGVRPKPSNHTLDRQSSMQSTLASPVVTEHSNVNMQALANEVAAVLLRTPSASNLTNTNSSLQSPAGVQPHPYKRMGLHTEDPSNTSHDHPPAYRTTMGTPSDTLRTNRS
ncbi:hypothetical protein BDN70DRAFT_56090 [Pholiota conissans]|uniref:Extracellular serine-rich protein n=1 Tax=Pholiota conissans TaxID=109636 RepID=A0A9P5ZCA3_9AGAR|nr:hypothetical protein BDN70DRAFT_56090 [Pholiota conissans]